MSQINLINLETVTKLPQKGVNCKFVLYKSNLYIWLGSTEYGGWYKINPEPEKL